MPLIRKLLGAAMLLAVIGFTIQSPRPRLETIKGSEDPGGIPNFYAWVHFFDTVASSYEVGGLSWYVGRQMGLEDMLQGEPETADRLLEALADSSTFANREQRRLRTRRGRLRDELQAGLISQAESDLGFLECVRQEVEQLRKDRQALRKEVLSLGGSLGPQLWLEIENYVEGPLKAGSTLQFDDSAFTREQRVILRTFDDKPKGRK